MKLGKSRRKQLLVCIWNNYSFRGQTTIRFVCEQLLVRLRMNTGLRSNDYWSLLYIGRWVNLYWSSHEAILVAVVTYIGQLSDQYRFTSRPRREPYPPDPFPTPYTTHPPRSYSVGDGSLARQIKGRIAVHSANHIRRDYPL